jgi:ABC transporter with metal-binding/Fe-S-binding domain ATP-binding protein
VRVAALYSGGKDSTFSIFKAKKVGHEVVSLITMLPSADDSALFHYPNIWLTKILAEAMQIPITRRSITYNGSKKTEFQALEKAVKKVKSDYDIQAIVHGGISSKFQRDIFEKICCRNDLAALAPIWNIEPTAYMYSLIDEKFHVKIVGVSAMGLERSWLGKSLDEASICQLESIGKKYRFNIAFEGGEAETLVLDCPLFTKKLDIKNANVHWDGQRGIFEILEVALIPK